MCVTKDTPNVLGYKIYVTNDHKYFILLERHEDAEKH